MEKDFSVHFVKHKDKPHLWLLLKFIDNIVKAGLYRGSNWQTRMRTSIRSLLRLTSRNQLEWLTISLLGIRLLG